MPQVVFAPAALLDLQCLREFLRPKNPAAAKRAAAAIIAAIQFLARHPQIGRPVEEIEGIETTGAPHRELPIDFGDSGYALRGGNCPDWIVPSGMQCKAQIAPRGSSHASNLQRGSAPAGGDPTGQFPPRKAYVALYRLEGEFVTVLAIRHQKETGYQ